MKTTPPQDSSKVEAAQQELMRRRAGQQVMSVLGAPGDFHRLQVRRLWEDHYRVNVVVGPDAVSAKIAHSFFLVTDSDGNITDSFPEITRHYESA